MDSVLEDYLLMILSFEGIYNIHYYYYPIDYLFYYAFHKLIYLKDEISLLCYNSIKYGKFLNVIVFELPEDRKSLNYKLMFYINIDSKEGEELDSSDIITFSENRVIYIVQKWHGCRISIYIIDFFDDYKNYLINKFSINISKVRIHAINRYSIIFKFKEILGFQLETMDGENGFVLLGYYNSTDPKQILNLKKGGLNYVINLGDYLNLQSNIFGYEIKHIKIIEVPSIESGLYLISNKTNIINSNYFVDINTEISLNFQYNGLLKKGNYLFKFVGVLEEPEFERIKHYSDEIIWSIEEEKIDKYTKIYDERRNLNITGRVALVQINILNDTKVFCDKKYDNTAIKSINDNRLLTCGYGLFFDVENDNEITQLNLGINYYFDKNKNAFIKCHKRCKTCSKEYNDTNMNCDTCYDNFFQRDGFCLEMPKCKYIYYYDNNLDLKCVEYGYPCPDFKPDEAKSTKECIEKCKIEDYKKNCFPTNNHVSINETSKQILDNKEYLNLENILFKNKDKFSIFGHNVSFIYTTSEKEKEEKLLNYNSSSILLNECENILKNKYSIDENIPIIIFKIETWDNHSNYMKVFYELYNPYNLSENLDLNLCENKYIEIRLPIVLSNYKLDLISKTKELGYNIFDLNDSFYHDICSVFTYNNSEISLSERNGIIDLTNENICMVGCNYSTFDIVTLRSICKCHIYNNNNNYENIINYKNDTTDENIFNFKKKYRYFKIFKY